MASLVRDSFPPQLVPQLLFSLRALPKKDQSPPRPALVFRRLANVGCRRVLESVQRPRGRVNQTRTFFWCVCETHLGLSSMFLRTALGLLGPFAYLQKCVFTRSPFYPRLVYHR